MNEKLFAEISLSALLCGFFNRTIQTLEEIRNLSADIFVILFFEKLSYLYSLLINFIPKS